MVRDPAPIIRANFEALRSVFLGVASRHDGVQSRWIIAESGYDEYLEGPDDRGWGQRERIRRSDFTLRVPEPYRVTPEQKQEIEEKQPDAKFCSSQDGNDVFYITPAVDSIFHSRGDIAAQDEFKSLSREAGSCLLRFLQIKKLALKLPELVPYNAIASERSHDGSTNLPSDLTERWLAFLHILGWQNLPLSPLRAVRSIWHEDTSIIGDPGELQKAFGMPKFQVLLERFPWPARYFESTMETDVNRASVYAIDAVLAGMIDVPRIDVSRLEKDLLSIPPGNENASRYHALVKEILAVIFEPDLHSPVCEEKLHDGRGFIDIVFENAAERGYFWDVPFRHKIMCPVVFFECKNYSGDIAGREISQLVSRFSGKRSNVGFIACRKIEDKDRVKKRCRDRFQDKHEHILVLEDSDLVEMLKMKAEGNTEAISGHLRSKFRPIFMDQ